MKFSKSSWWNRQPSTGGYIFFTGDFKDANGDSNPDPTTYWSIWIDDFGTLCNRERARKKANAREEERDFAWIVCLWECVCVCVCVWMCAYACVCVDYCVFDCNIREPPLLIFLAVTHSCGHLTSFVYNFSTASFPSFTLVTADHHRWFPTHHLWIPPTNCIRVCLCVYAHLSRDCENMGWLRLVGFLKS